jgi:outer membrane protein OmpA-like peptidoglycan-associated protein
MFRSKILLASLASVSMLGLSACVTDPNTGERKVSRTAIGGIGGAVLGGLAGDLIGGRTGRIIGAAAGGVAGGAVGYRMDEQIRELREQTAGTGIDVTEDVVDGQEAIRVNLPDGVTFATGSATINSRFRDTLDDVAESLTRYPSSLIDVYGYTDSTGSEEFNMQLSDRRAQAVADYLVARGVDRSRIRSRGFGEDPRYAVGDNATEAGRALNRRVEILIVPFDQQDVEEARAAQN